MYRFTQRWIYAKATIGLEIGARKDTERSPVTYEPISKGAYGSLTLGYRLRNGVLFGASLGLFTNRRFKRDFFELTEPYATEYLETDVFPFEDVRDAPDGAVEYRNSDEQLLNFPTLSLTIGYTFPQWGKEKEEL